MHISLSTQGSLVPGHCIISPNDHVLAITELESDELEDLQELKRKVLKLYKEEYGKKGIFVEAVYRLEDCNHTFVECFPIDADALEDLYATVMQELSEADDEWTDNKKIIKVGSANLQNCIPKGFPYIYFDFNMEKGLAHVIENYKRFKKDFAINMLAESLNLDLLFVRKKVGKGSLQLMAAEFLRKWNRLS